MTQLLHSLHLALRPVRARPIRPWDAQRARYRAHGVDAGTFLAKANTYRQWANSAISAEQRYEEVAALQRAAYPVPPDPSPTGVGHWLGGATAAGGADTVNSVRRAS